jgi:galactose mutarotase-like enzyme
MCVKIYNSLYKDIEAVTLENDLLKVQFVPEYGGKMVSFLYKPLSREFLRQAEGGKYKVLKYDGNYVEAECSGFDDMFPSIDRMLYPDYPWKGVEIPDHGEVCGLKWDWKTADGCLYMSVNGVRFPYRLEKTISFKPDGSLHIDYRAANHSRFDMDFLWTAHVMVDTGDGGEIITPYKESQDARVVFSSDQSLGSYGDIITWPVTRDACMRNRQINLVRDDGDCIEALKFYFSGKVPEGRCGFHYRSDNIKLVLRFPADVVPYLGILTSSRHGLILEPCTAAMDRPDMAKLFGQNSVLPADGEYTWYLDMNVEYDG